MMHLIFVFIICVWTSCHAVLGGDPPKLNPFTFPKDLIVGSRARVLCAAYLGEFPLTFRWQKDGRDITLGRVQQIDASTSELTLEPLTIQHIGNYSCMVTNAFGNDALSAQLVVKAPPEWIKEPSDTRVSVGQKLVLDCEAFGSPPVVVNWKRRSPTLGELVPIIPSWNIQILPNNTLTIGKIQKDDDGVYVCEVSNGVREGLTKSVHVTVYEVPSVQTISDHVSIERGKTVMLSCLASVGSSSLSWMRNGQFVTDITELSGRFAMSEQPSDSGMRFTLTLFSSERTDAGLYVCAAQNEYGSDEKVVQLTVVERPDAPEAIEVVDIWSQSARIRWSAPSSGNSPIINYTIEYWSSKGIYRNKTVSSVTTTSILRNLTSFTVYKVQIWAINNVGASDPSEQVKFTTAKEEPSAPPTDLKLEKTGSTFVRLSWKPPPADFWNGGIAGYYIGFKRTSSNQPYTFNSVDSIEETVYYVLRGLRKSTTYSAVVRAYNDIGIGPKSQEIVFTTHSREPPPRPIVMINGIGSTYLQVQWFLRDDSTVTVNGFSLNYRRNASKWKEINIPDASQTTFTLTNLDSGVSYQIFMTSYNSFGMSEPSDTATVQTTAEHIIHAVAPPTQSPQSNVDDFTPTLYITISVSVSMVIIVTVIVCACVYVYSKKPLPIPQPYCDTPPDKNFTYMATVPRFRETPPSTCTGLGAKQSSPYSTTPLTTSEEEEPIYESVVDEMRCRIKQRIEDEKKFGSGTIV